MHISTHNIPLSVLIKYLEPYAGNIVLIGIQPKKLSGEITESVKKNANKLVKIIKNGELEKIEKI
jgi:Ni,Fe-hydrogenase maturation factor